MAKEFWLKMIAWDMGWWKTFNVYQDAFIWKQRNPYWLLIANIPYDFVDMHFSKEEDLDDILLFLVNYIADTNNTESLKEDDFPLIRLIIDEAHTYFPARGYQKFSLDFVKILTQCRKRNISIDIVTQRLWQIDVFIRRLCWVCTWYTDLFFGFRKVVYYDIWDGDKVNKKDFDVIYKDIQYPTWFNVRVNKNLQKYFDQRYLTNYVVWVNRIFTSNWLSIKEQEQLKPLSPFKKQEYLKFRELLQSKAINENKPISPNFDDYSESGAFTSKSLDV